MMEIEDHWLIGVRRVYSPHQDCRSIPATDIDLLVLHGISLPPGEFGGPYIEQFFCNQLDARVHPYFRDISHLRVSAHVVVYRSGEGSNLCLSTKVRGMQANRNIKVELAATSFPSE